MPKRSEDWRVYGSGLKVRAANNLACLRTFSGGQATCPGGQATCPVGQATWCRPVAALCVRGYGRQRDARDRAAAIPGQKVDRPSLEGKETPDDRESEPGATLLRRVKGLEQPFGFGVAEAGTPIDDVDPAGPAVFGDHDLDRLGPIPTGTHSATGSTRLPASFRGRRGPRPSCSGRRMPGLTLPAAASALAAASMQDRSKLDGLGSPASAAWRSE